MKKIVGISFCYSDLRSEVWGGKKRENERERVGEGGRRGRRGGGGGGRLRKMEGGESGRQITN